jgi:hypothetical protein
MNMLYTVLVAIIAAAPVMAQSPASAVPPTTAIAAHPEWPKARPGDVDSVDHILAAVYDVISGPAHQPRDWERFKSLFVPGARLIPIKATGTSADVTELSVEDYATRASKTLEVTGFFERSTHNVVEQFGDVAHVFSTYESRHVAAEEKPFARGINSFQLLKDGNRFWIVTIYWEAEMPGLTIPAKYLPTSGTDARSLNQNMTGEWVGQLEYRDFQTNERVFLPTWMSMEPSSDGNAVTLSYTYDDGPTKTVKESSTLAFSTASKTATLTSNSDHTSERYAVSGLEEFAKLNRGTLVLTGPGQENDKPVDVRITVTLRRNLFTFVKETKPAGADFKFRDGYTFTRKDAPSM